MHLLCGLRRTDAARLPELRGRAGAATAPRAEPPLNTAVHPFQLIRASSFEEAAALVHGDAMLLAGGTDLVPLLKDGLARPGRLVDLKRIPGGSAVSVTRARGARIGALARLADLAGHRAVRRRFPAFAEACRGVGTVQIRNAATLGGNLCQRPRCWYYRSGIACWKSGAATCPAQHGVNEHLAILGGGPCWAVHPSDPAVALLALDARVTVRRANGSVRDLPIGDLYVLPQERPETETCLTAGEVIERITVPPRFAGVRQAFVKVMHRQAWDFALASAAVVWPKRARRPRVAVGGVAPIPWFVDPERLPTAPGPQAKLDRRTLWATRVADIALRGARPLAQNRYKIKLAKAAVRRALLQR